MNSIRVAREEGQAIVVTALCLFALMGAAALAIDIGSLQDGRDSLRGVADAASFAGARMLTGSSPAASGTCATTPANPAGAAACAAANANLASLHLTNPQIAWQTDYQNVSTQMEVNVTARSPSLFARVFGIGSTAITVSSAANIKPGVAGAPLALFASDSSCSGGIQFLKNNDAVSGAVISNGTIAVDGNERPLITGPATYGGPQSCSGPTADQVNGTITKDPTVKPYPETFGLPTTVVSGCCTSSTTSLCSPSLMSPLHVFTSGTSGTTIDNSSQAGIYCSTGTITVTPGTTANVTLIAPKIGISGNPGHGVSAYTLTPYYTDPTGQKLLLYQNGTSPIDFPANGNDLTGVIFLPNASAEFEKNNTFSGVLEATDITFDFNNGANFVGTGPAQGQTNTTIAYTQ